MMHTSAGQTHKVFYFSHHFPARRTLYFSRFCSLRGLLLTHTCSILFLKPFRLQRIVGAIFSLHFPNAKLHAGNAESHLLQHEKWWKVVKDAGAKGLDTRAAFQDLMRGKKRRVVQQQATVNGFLTKAQARAGLVEKELRLVIWMVRNKIAFNAVEDSAFKELLQSFGVKLSSAKTLKRYLLLLSEIALRHAEAQIKEAGSYSIALDYWTSVAKDKYLAITYHYADKDMNVRSRVLDLVPVEGNATALLTSQLVEQRVETHFELRRAIFK
jgi:hypothetical protein